MTELNKAVFAEIRYYDFCKITVELQQVVDHIEMTLFAMVSADTAKKISTLKEQARECLKAIENDPSYIAEKKRLGREVSELYSKLTAEEKIKWGEMVTNAVC